MRAQPQAWAAVALVLGASVLLAAGADAQVPDRTGGAGAFLLRAAASGATTPAADLQPRARLRALEVTSGAETSPGTASMRRRVLLPVLLSAAVPGAGEISMGHWWNGLPLVAAEVATWVGYAHYQDEGRRIRDAYQRFADAHWDFDRWQDSLQTYFDGQSGERLHWWDPASPYNCNCSPPFIPKEEDAQEYYENAGKYRHFWVGWDDWRYNAADPWNSDSAANRRKYVDMRIDSNNNFDNATRMIGVAAGTRVLSMLQSLWLARRGPGSSSFRITPIRLAGRGGGVRLTWKY